MKIESQKRIWDAHGKADPLWAVVTDPRYRGGKWEDVAFFRTGEREIDAVMGRLNHRGLKPKKNGLALDFGCGVGRLTRAMSKRFRRVFGVDVSDSMVERAKWLNADLKNAGFYVNASWGLETFGSASLDFIYASITLQHIPPVRTEGYLREFLRILKPGSLLVFNLPCANNVGWLKLLRYNLRLRTRAKQLLQYFGAYYPGFDPHPIPMYFVPKDRVESIVWQAGGEVVDCVSTNTTDPTFYKGIRFFKKEAAVSYPTLMYTVRKAQ